jgi:hypothetical protein
MYRCDTSWMAGVRFLAEQEIFLHFTASRLALKPGQPPVYWVSGINLHGLQADHSYQSNAESKNGGTLNPLSHIPSWRGA